MTRVHLTLLAAAGSLALLSGAFAFQAAGFAPCQMCLWQRWPHGVAIGAGVLAVATGWAIWLAAGALAALSTAGIGAYHAGVEQGWWPGPSSCSGASEDLGALSGPDLLSTDTTASVVMCDEIVWSLAGVSMAGWNAILSLCLAALWLAALLRRAR